jgi:hypothetical protein
MLRKNPNDSDKLPQADLDQWDFVTIDDTHSSNRNQFLKPISKESKPIATDSKATGFFDLAYDYFFSTQKTSKPDIKSSIHPSNIFTQKTQAYIAKMSKQPQSYSDIIAKLNLSPAEARCFEKFRDPLTFHIMNTPVLLNKTVYNLKSLENLSPNQNGARKDPFSNKFFYMNEIQPSEFTTQAIEATILEIQSRRKAKNMPLMPPPNDGLDGPPGGPRF